MASTPNEERRRQPGSRWLIIAAAATILALAYGNAFNLIPDDQRDNPKLIANIIITCAVLAVAARVGLRTDELGIEPRRARSGMWGVAVGVAAAIPLMLFILVVPLITGENVGDDDGKRPSLGGLLSRIGARILVGTAIPEEIIFRGLLFALWQRAGGLGAAIVASSVAFGLWHAVITVDTVANSGIPDHAAVLAFAYAGTLIGLTGGGVLLAVLRWRTRSVAAPVMLHWTFNGLLIATAWLRA